ncbi:hypothetical protein Scep_014115 [Stephania cephalantha]|uniref:Alpha-N-acetylglucosaminidase n=2 Tax=Stephania cephalantha TaxID=152367 RepID=A0AAP0J0N5_9MAGN
MAEGDKDAIWLMQGWLFSSDSAFWKPPQMEVCTLHSVPFGKMIVLDLFAEVKPIWEVSSQFYGTPYIWCMLHNFGGNIEMYGLLDVISSGPIDARVSQNSTMVGVGLCMEGIEQNPIVYELMSEMAFRHKKVHVKLVKPFLDNSASGMAEILLPSTIWIITKTTIVEFPDWDPTRNFPSPKEFRIRNGISWGKMWRFSFRETLSNLPHPHLWYSTEKVIYALQLFLDAGEEFAGSLTYRYDLVDLTRQVLSKLANQVYLDAVTAFQQNNATALVLHSQKFLRLIKDIDTLLASDDNFLLGTWLESAKKLAANPTEMKQYEWNARTQVTMWYDNTETNQSRLHDYANKFWSGLLEGYYLPRAATYFARLLKSLRQNQRFQLEDWRREWILYSNRWQSGQELYPVKAQGDSLAISKALFKKYLS